MKFVGLSIKHSPKATLGSRIFLFLKIHFLWLVSCFFGCNLFHLVYGAILLYLIGVVPGCDLLYPLLDSDLGILVEMFGT